MHVHTVDSSTSLRELLTMWDGLDLQPLAVVFNRLPYKSLGESIGPVLHRWNVFVRYGLVFYRFIDKMVLDPSMFPLHKPYTWSFQANASRSS